MFVLGIATLTATLVTVFPSNALAAQIDVVQCHPTDTHFVDDPRECHMYFTCYQGQPTPMMCPPGFKFVEALQACYQVPVDECFPCPETGIKYFPHPKSCQKYVMCFVGAAHEMTCAEGLLFNPAVGQCDLEANVDCAI
ncbi:peritrophin-1-like isoform X2 [Aedes albopictus]|uniref:Chitin-binding type-2 domain-containing protein n=1 Tax=Aedes albopictus TaxID=7160 RepID=A0ABM1XQX7_AEDAL